MSARMPRLGLSTAPVTVCPALAGVDDVDSYQQLCDFVRTVSGGSPVRRFVVHCRKALLNLDTVKNRTVPPLRRGWAFALRRDFPHLQFSVNGQARISCVCMALRATACS
jgi:tRNA-dihydrouridine synthase A